MIEVLKAFYLVFGVLTAAGGLIGFLKDRSIPSIMVGLPGGLVLIASSILLGLGKGDIALSLGMTVCAGMAGAFVPKVMINRAPAHVIVMAILSLTGLVLTLIAFSRK